MEAFVIVSECQRQVTTQGTDGNEIYISKAFVYNKPAYQKPKAESDDVDSGNSDSDDEKEHVPIRGQKSASTNRINSKPVLNAVEAPQRK
jgi:hypothetical protein